MSPPRGGAEAPTNEGFVEDPTAVDYAVAAEFGLRTGDLVLARTQIAAALTFDPLDEGRLALADRILVASGAASRKPGATFFGDIALRARALTRTGDRHQALVLLLEAVNFRPSVPYLAWTEGWPEDALAAKHGQDDDIIAGIARFAEVLPQAGAHPRNVDAVVRLATSLASPRAPALRATNAAVLCSLIERRRGSPERGRVLVGQVHARKPHPRTAAELGRVGVALRDFELGARWFAEAERLDPRDQAVVLDRADTELASGAFEEAAESYARGRLLGPSPWADASRAHVQARLGRDHAEHLAALAAIVSNRAADSGLRQHAATLLADARAFVLELPLPDDALTSICLDHLRRIASSPASGSSAATPPVRLRVQADHPAPPSLRLAFARGCEAFGREGSLEITPAPGAPLPLASEAFLVVEGEPVVRSSRAEPSAEDRALALALVTASDDLPAFRARLESELPVDPEALLRVALAPPVPPRDRHPLRFVLELHALATACLAEHARLGRGDALATLRALARDADAWLAGAALTALGPFLRDASLDLEALFEALAEADDRHVSRAARRALLAFAPTLSAERRRALAGRDIVSLIYERPS